MHLRLDLGTARTAQTWTFATAVPKSIGRGLRPVTYFQIKIKNSMALLEKIKTLVKALERLPYIGRLFQMCSAYWRGPQTRAMVFDIGARMAALESRQGQQRDLVDGFGAAIQGMEATMQRHQIELSSQQKLNEKLFSLESKCAEFAEKIKWAAIDSDNIRSRLEFIRKETMFELRKQLNITQADSQKTAPSTTPRFVNEEKIRQMTVKSLNLGCGHLPEHDYINVDSRELPGVDLVSDVCSLPFEPSSIRRIRAAHLAEHFSDHALREIVLPHWHQLLQTGGELILVAPDAEAMMNAYSNGDYSFEETREIIFGGQEYEGDFHFTMLTTHSTIALLKSAGFSAAQVIAAARKNGACLEFEVHARK